MHAQKYHILRLILVAAFMLSGCSPFPPFLPTQVPGAINTIVAQTAAAIATQTAASLPTIMDTPTDTPPPTNTTLPPTETPTPTATFVFILPTPTASSTPTRTPTAIGGGGSTSGQCQLVSQKPANFTRFKPQDDFDAKWTVKNTSSKTWDDAAVDLVYVSGTEMHKNAAYDLETDVAAGESIELIVDMISPKKEGTYFTTWALKQVSTTLCSFSLTIIVAK